MNIQIYTKIELNIIYKKNLKIKFIWQPIKYFFFN